MMSLLNLLDEISQWAGIAQIGSVRPDRKVLVPSQTSSESARRLEALWHAVADTYNLCKLHRRAATQLRWRFEKGTLCCLQGEEGVVVAFLTNHAAADQLMARVTKRMEGLLGSQQGEAA